MTGHLNGLLSGSAKATVRTFWSWWLRLWFEEGVCEDLGSGKEGIVGRRFGFVDIAASSMSDIKVRGMYSNRVLSETNVR